MIKKLNNKLINQIAAGEVVDDPSSIIKELIENAIDSKATKITISLISSGLDKIIIKDNGVGMNKKDLQLCFERFTTSKISKLDDLQNIKSLGFRGEALASIASISQLNIKSKHKSSSTGNEIQLDFGKRSDIKPSAIDNGTIIDVSKIFFNVPVRKKFMKSENIEYRKIIQTINLFSLSNPNIEFIVSNNNKIINHYKKEFLENRIINVLGKPFKSNLLEINYKKDNYQITGFIGSLSVVKKRRGNQYIYINNRYIKNRLIDITVFNCYRALLERGEYPFYLLKINYPYDEIDVNVHPKKIEIKFRNEHKIQYLINKAIAIKLKEVNKVIPSFSTIDQSTELIENMQLDFKSEKIQTLSNYNDATLSTAEKRISITNNKDTEELIIEDKKIWQIHNKYIITELTSGIVIIDQHVAHERILYEIALDALENKGLNSQSILFPQTIEFNQEDFTYFNDILPYLIKIGFKIRIFGDNAIIVEGVPPELPLGKEKEIIKEVLEHSAQNKKINSSFIEYMAATYACKAAIKAGDSLSYTECSELIDKLFNTNYPYYCPHGRPIIVNLTIDELDKRFERH